MSTSPAAERAGSPLEAREWVTMAAAGVVAMVAADLVHEALGHGTACLLTGNKILTLSTVALQTAEASRVVSAAGTTANVIAGVLSLVLFSRVKRVTPSAWFAWLFGVFNLMNLGYLTASAATNTSDWARVIAGWSPAWLWRCVMGLAGAVLYVLSANWAARLVTRRVEAGEIGLADLPGMIWPAYVAAGIVMTLASVFNPIGPQLILGSGAGPSFGLNAGLLFIPGMVKGGARTHSLAAKRLRLPLVWIGLAVLFGGVFVGVLGPGVRF